MALMTVYHGGYQAVEKPEIRADKNTKDFGTVFIMKIQITFLNAIRKIRYYKEYGCRMLVSDEEKPTWKKKL